MEDRPRRRLRVPERYRTGTVKAAVAEEEPQLFCVCEQPYHGEAMICCDTCAQWFHPLCQNMSDDEYFRLFAPGIAASNAAPAAWQCCSCSEHAEAEALPQQVEAVSRGFVGPAAAAALQEELVRLFL